MALRPEILYREELQCLIELVVYAIGNAFTLDLEAMASLGHLHIKLTALLRDAPSARTPEAAA